MLDILLPLSDGLVLTQSTDTLTELPVSIADIARRVGYNHSIEVAVNVTEALDNAERLVGNSGTICVMGSVYIVGEARTYYHLEPGHAAYL